MLKPLVGKGWGKRYSPGAKALYIEFLLLVKRCLLYIGAICGYQVIPVMKHPITNSETHQHVDPNVMNMNTVTSVKYTSQNSLP